MKQSVKQTKALAKQVGDSLPERLLKGDKPQSLKNSGQRKVKDQSETDRIEASYNQLDGEWLEWLEVARRFEHKVPSQDRLDLRHDIMIELHRARQRDGEPIPTLRAYRIASLTRALYWRKLNKTSTPVCIRDGTAKTPDHESCHFQHKPSKCSACPFRASRPLVSLDSDIGDSEGNTIALKETVADDHAIDLVAKLDASDWLLGCKMQVIQIATKQSAGIELNRKEKNYLYHFRNRELKKSQKTLL